MRPSIGVQVAVGLFQTSRDLKLFDFRRFDQPLERQTISLWHADYEKREEALIMLKYLQRLIAQPVRSEETDYIMTQAMAEFLHFKVDGGFDGIMFRSVQDESGCNNVLFEEKNIQPGSFPVKLPGDPLFHMVSKVAYHGSWEPKPPPVFEGTIR